MIFETHLKNVFCLMPTLFEILTWYTVKTAVDFKLKLG